MTKNHPAADRLLEILMPLIPRQSAPSETPTALPRMRLWAAGRAIPPTPSLANPMFYAVLQGKKFLTLAGQRFSLAKGDCATSSFGSPYMSEVPNATPSIQYVALSLDFDVDLLRDVMLDLPSSNSTWVCGAAQGELDGPLGEIVIRLAGLLFAPEDRAMLARSYERELYYRLLQGPMGATLRQLGHRDERTRQITKAADWLMSNADKSLVVPDLAQLACMSLTSFYRHFKAMTGYSPLAFQRQIRLLEARRLLVSGNVTVSRVAYEVGYVSPSQFSREYKSLFGVPPVADLDRTDGGVVP